MAETLGDALPAEMKRMREEVIPAYQSIGPSGNLAIALMNQSLTRSEQALVSGDLGEMIACLEDLRSYKL